MESLIKILRRYSVMNNLLGRTFITAYLIGVVVFTSSFSFVGCHQETSDTGSDTGSGTIDPEAYFVDQDRYIIDTEYPTYLYVIGNGSSVYRETRPIFAGGITTDLTCKKVWWSYFAEECGSLSEYGNRKDSYWDESTDKYTARVLFNPNTTFTSGSTYTFNINIGNSNKEELCHKTFYVRMITERTYPIKYSYQSGLNVFDNSISYECNDRLKKAFSEANTTISLTDEKAGTLSQDTVQFYDPDFPGEACRGLDKYIKTKIDDSPEDTKFRLVGAYNISSDAPSGEYGWTIRLRDLSTDPPTFGYGASFIFYNRTSSFSGDKRKKLITYGIIHELGHLRGQNENITDQAHTVGHNGINKAMCVMLIPNEPNLDAKLNNPVFCSGHQQFLLNRE